jgi:hypothetical protein
LRGDGQNQLKISAPHLMTETYRLISILAALISLDSPFNASIFVCAKDPTWSFYPYRKAVSDMTWS